MESKKDYKNLHRLYFRSKKQAEKFANALAFTSPIVKYSSAQCACGESPSIDIYNSETNERELELVICEACCKKCESVKRP